MNEDLVNAGLADGGPAYKETNTYDTNMLHK